MRPLSLYLTGSPPSSSIQEAFLQCAVGMVTQLHGTAAPAEHLSERFQNNTKVSSLCVQLEFLTAAEKAFLTELKNARQNGD